MHLPLRSASGSLEVRKGSRRSQIFFGVQKQHFQLGSPGHTKVITKKALFLGLFFQKNGFFVDISTLTCSTVFYEKVGVKLNYSSPK